MTFNGLCFQNTLHSPQATTPQYGLERIAWIPDAIQLQCRTHIREVQTLQFHYGAFSCSMWPKTIHLDTLQVNIHKVHVHVHN